MKKYRLNDLDDEWIFKAENEDQATLIYINQIVGTEFTNVIEAVLEFENYMVKHIGQKDPQINWTEV